MSAAPAPLDSELLSALTSRQLWAYHRAPHADEQQITKDMDADRRIKAGDFVVGIRVSAVKEGVVLDGTFDVLVPTRPQAIRDLRGLGVPPSLGVLVGEQRSLRAVETRVAANLWQYLLANDPGLATFFQLLGETRSAPDLTALFARYQQVLWPPHREAIEHAIGVANAFDRDLTLPILFASFLQDAGRRYRENTLSYVASVLGRLRGSTDVLEILDLRKQNIRTLDAGDRALRVTTETEHVVERFLFAANEIRGQTDNTPEIRTRHIAATLLLTTADHLRSLGIHPFEVCGALYEFIIEHVDVDHDRWRKLLVIPADPPQPPSPAPEPPPPRKSNFAIETIVSRDTWTTEDNLGYQLYAQAITESILKGQTEPPLTIGIQAPWGQGKTSLMRMMQERLDPGASKRDEFATGPVSARTAITTTYQQLIEWTKQFGDASIPVEGMLKPGAQTVPTIWFNPLYYRETSQVWAGMAHAILHQLVDRLSVGNRELFWFRLQQSRINTEAIRSEIHNRIFQRFLPLGAILTVVTVLVAAITAFGPAGVSLAGSIAAVLGGTGAAGTIYAVFKAVLAKKTIDGNFDKYVTEPNYRTELGLLHLIDHDLDRALGLLVGNRPIAVFIDDLDRCDPQTVNQVILAINQFLSLPRRNVFFFLGMDMEMVAAALEQAQKEQGLAAGGTSRRSFGWRFMEKFVQLPFVIPHLEQQHAQEFAEAYLRGKAAVVPPPAPEELLQKIKAAPTASAVGAIVAELPPEAPPEVRRVVQSVASSHAAKLMESNESEEMKAIAKMAVEDLELNPRTIVRYFGLVRVLRNIQVSCGKSSDDDTDRKLVLRAAHLLMNWPQFVQWLRNEPKILTARGEWSPTIAEIESLAERAATLRVWSNSVSKIAHGASMPPYLTDPALYTYLRKLATEKPGLQEMYTARLF